MLAALVVGVVGLFLLPTLAASAPTGAIVPPFTKGTAIHHSWGHVAGTCGAVANVTIPTSANLSTGGVGISLSTYASQCGEGSAAAQAGFVVPFNVATTGAHNISVKWTIPWKGGAVGHTTCVTILVTTTCYVARAHIFAYLQDQAVDLTNGSTVGANQSHRFAAMSRENGSRTVAEVLNTTLVISGMLVHGHSYAIKTWIQVSILASGSCAVTVLGCLSSGYLASSAYFVLGAPSYDASLLWASIR
ncbi:MAG: hypothetical protein L3K15_05765 [Thermoplasmata archaeon]|nr:hypothetical protein [Thermoplasmata archaeon]